MNRGIEVDLDRPRYLSPSLIHALDTQLAEAVRAVEDGTVAKVQVSVTFTLAFDEDAGLVADYALKHTHTQKGAWQPSGAGQMRLLEEEER